MSSLEQRKRLEQEAREKATALAQIEGAIPLLKKGWVAYAGHRGHIEGGVPYPSTKDEYCALEALNVAGGYGYNDDEHHTLAEKLILEEAERVVAKRFGAEEAECICESIPTWNDDGPHGKRGILGVFRRVAKRLQEMVGFRLTADAG